MKKSLKYVVSLLLAAAMSVSSLGLAFAADNDDINVPDHDNDDIVSGDENDGGGGGGYSLSYGNQLKEEEEPFIDVEPDDWFYDYVVYVYKNGYMAGTSDTEFSPNNTLTRGMVATILYRMAGEPAVEYSTVFTDLADEQWYTDGMIWAINEGIIAGYGDGTCRPEALITIEQLASILYRHAGSPEISEITISHIPGYEDISDYAVDAMQWADDNGMLRGEALRPGYAASRAEAAMMFTIFDQNK